MTLSRFLRDYLYIPLGGNRRGESRRYANLLVTMVLGGLWHGASWNFVLWGAIHGFGLVVNHLWREVSARTNIFIPRLLAWPVTLFLVIFAWVPFRADTFAASLTLWSGMLGLNGVGAWEDPKLERAMVWIVLLFAIALFAPNTQEILCLKWQSQYDKWWSWRPSVAWALVMGCMFGVAVASMIEKPTMFLYFRF